jgi:voltage-gated potassium channel Kch
MRILLYIEPHPIRDSQRHFKDIARQLLPLLEHNRFADIRLYANRDTLGQIDGDLREATKAAVIEPTEAEERLFARYHRSWDREAIDNWLSLLTGGAVAEEYLPVLRRIRGVFPFDVIVHWGENGAVTRFIQDLPVTRIAMELGCTRPPFIDTVVFDSFGTNGGAIVPRLGLADIRDAVGGDPMPAAEAIFAYSETIEALGHEQSLAPMPADLAPVAYGRSRRIAFLPLQLYDDANLLRFSPYASLRDVVLDVVPRLADAGYTVIVKPHPASKHRPDGMAENAVARGALAPWHRSIVWCDPARTWSNPKLIAMSDFVVTVNSSVGFEALYYDKPVVPLGEAVYAPRDLFPTLDEVIEGRFDHAAYLAGIGLLRRFMLGGYLAPANARSEIQAFHHRVATLDGLRRRHGDDPRAIACGYFAACSVAQQNAALHAMFAGRSAAGRAGFQQPRIAPGGQAPSAPAGGPLMPAARRLVDHSGFAGADAFGSWLTETWGSPEWRETLVRVAGLVDPDFYRDHYKDIARAGVDPVQHYAARGVTEGRAPSRALLHLGKGDMLEALRSAAEELFRRRGTALAQAMRPVVSRSGTTDAAAFAQWLRGAWPDPAMRTEVVRLAGLVDPGYYLAANPEVVEPGFDPVTHYAEQGVFQGRPPCATLSHLAGADMLEALIEAGGEAFLLRRAVVDHHPLDAAWEARLEGDLGALRHALRDSAARIAVVAHCYYRDLVPEIIAALGAIPEAFDLVVTLPDWGDAPIRAMIASAYPRAVFVAAPNRGRDIAPFLHVLPAVLARGYDAVLKIQTKRGYYLAGHLLPELGELWRRLAFGSLLGSTVQVADILAAFRDEPELNMVGTATFHLPVAGYPHHDGGHLARFVLGDGADPLSGSFFAGTMFWVRPNCLRPLADAVTGLGLTDFPAEDGAADGALAHLVERLFGQVALANGGRIATVDPLTRRMELDPVPMAARLHDVLTELHARQASAPEGEVLLWG